eukprot:gene20906-27098_t
MLRSPWNNNPSNYISRYNQTYSTDSFDGFPECKSLQSCFDSVTMAEFSSCFGGDTHGPVHVLIGGAWNEPELINDPDVSFLKDDQYLKALRVLEDPGYVGEMYTSGASFDPTFWPIHGSSERLYDLKRILISQGDITDFDETFSYPDYNVYSGDIYLQGRCDWSNVKSVDDLTLPTCSSDAICSGLPTASIFQSGLAIAAVVAFHEAGHFLAARLQGYGPKVFSFNDSSSIEYALRLFPLGGYVAFPSNIEYDENRPAIQRLVVISAGVIANFLLSFLLCTGVAFTTGQQLDVSVTPRSTGLKSKGSIGIGITSRLNRLENKKPLNVIEAAELGYDETSRLTSITVQSLQNLIDSGFSGNGDVGGPIAVIKAGAVMAESNPVALVGFMAALS